MLRILLELFIAIIFFLLMLCLIIPKARKYFLLTIRDSLGELWDIVADSAPGKQKGFRAFLLFLLALALVSLVAALFIPLLLLAGPTNSIIKALLYPKMVDNEMQLYKDLHEPLPQKSHKTKEEILGENRIEHEKMMSVRFTVDQKDLRYEPDEHEIFFFTPEPCIEVEKAIFSQYDEIKDVFEQRHFRFVFLPCFNKELKELLNSDKLSYYNPKTTNLSPIPNETLSYQDLKEALKIPAKVDGPCFIRCKVKDCDPLIFSFHKIELPEDGNMIPIVQEYLSNVGDGRLYHLSSEEVIQDYIEGKPADERFDEDIYLIGKEIKERIEQLRAKGLSSLAIRKLIGDDADNPSKLVIDRHNKIFLPDYNKEIKLSPIHKAVFFLFLNHPEGIYFKDLADYRKELGDLYKSITGRDSIEDIEDSIDKLTNPLDNSINEKCARIKNAFVSEFREELAQWYFIDGRKGEKKTIKISRDLVIWEIKD